MTFTCTGSRTKGRQDDARPTKGLEMPIKSAEARSCNPLWGCCCRNWRGHERTANDDMSRLNTQDGVEYILNRSAHSISQPQKPQGSHYRHAFPGSRHLCLGHWLFHCQSHPSQPCPPRETRSLTTVDQTHQGGARDHTPSSNWPCPAQFTRWPRPPDGDLGSQI